MVFPKRPQLTRSGFRRESANAGEYRAYADGNQRFARRAAEDRSQVRPCGCRGRGKAVAQENDVGGKFEGAVVCGSSRRSFSRGPQTNLDQFQEKAVGLGLGNSAHMAAGTRCSYSLMRWRKTFRYTDLPDGGAEKIDGLRYLTQVVIDDHLTGHLQRVACAIRGHEWIAVAIAADPRTKGKDARQFRSCSLRP